MVRYEGEKRGATNIVTEVVNALAARNERKRAETEAKKLGALLISRMGDTSTHAYYFIPLHDHELTIELQLPDRASAFKHAESRPAMTALSYSFQVTSSEKGIARTKVVFYPNTVGFMQYQEDMATAHALRVTKNLCKNNGYYVFGPPDKPGIIFDADLQSRVFGHTANLLVEARQAVLQSKQR